MGRREERISHRLCFRRHGDHRRVGDRIAHVLLKVAIGLREIVWIKTKQESESLGLAIVALARPRCERFGNQLADGENGIDKRRVDPTKRGFAVGGVGCSISERSRDPLVDSMKPASRAQRVIEVTKCHCKNDLKGSLETPTQIDKRLRMLGDCRGDGRVRELQQNGSSRAEEVRDFSTVLPRQRTRAVNSRKPVRDLASQRLKRGFEHFSGDFHGSVLISRAPGSMRRSAPRSPALVYEDSVKWASTVSTSDRLEDALSEAAETIEQRLGSAQPDLVIAFASTEYGPHLGLLGKELEQAFPGALLFGCSAPGVIGGGRELENERSLSLTAARLPGVEISPMIFSADPTRWNQTTASLTTKPTDVIVLSDTVTGEAPALIEFLDRALPEATKLGGLAGSGEPGETSLFLGDRHLRSGSIAVGLHGNVEMVTGVAQGCRPIGAPMFITRHKGPLILELDGKPALRALDGMFASLPPEDRLHAKGRLVVGLSMSSSLETYEQGDFLIRDLGGVDPDSGAVVISGQVSGDQILQFHLRDAETSSEDMADVISRHLYSEPRGALLFSCVGRGRKLYGSESHDSQALLHALGPVPLGGFFSNGEIGPVAGRTYLHAYTSAFGLFRPKHVTAADVEV